MAIIEVGLPAAVCNHHCRLPDHSVAIDFHPPSIGGEAAVERVVVNRLRGRGDRDRDGCGLGRLHCLRGDIGGIGRLRLRGRRRRCLLRGGGLRDAGSLQDLVPLDHRRHHCGRHTDILQIHDLIPLEIKPVGGVVDVGGHDRLVHTGVCQTDDLLRGRGRFDTCGGCLLNRHLLDRGVREGVRHLSCLRRFGGSVRGGRGVPGQDGWGWSRLTGSLSTGTGGGIGSVL